METKGVWRFYWRPSVKFHINDSSPKKFQFIAPFFALGTRDFNWARTKTRAPATSSSSSKTLAATIVRFPTALSVVSAAHYQSSSECISISYFLPSLFVLVSMFPLSGFCLLGLQGYGQVIRKVLRQLQVFGEFFGNSRHPASCGPRQTL